MKKKEKGNPQRSSHKLSLHRETLRCLAPADLATVRGGEPEHSGSCFPSITRPTLPI